jgi:ribosome recycling factor
MKPDTQAKIKGQLSQILDLVADDLKGVKTGRAKPSLIEDLRVEAYNTSMTLKELASITSPNPQSLLVVPWDKTILQAVEKAIDTSNLGLHGVVDNDLVRINIPPLTEETRKDLVKLVMQKIESGRKLIRQSRNEIKKEIEDFEGQPGVSEDDIKTWLEEMQSLVDEANEKLEEMGRNKEKELMTI